MTPEPVQPHQSTLAKALNNQMFSACLLLLMILGFSVLGVEVAAHSNRWTTAAIVVLFLWTYANNLAIVRNHMTVLTGLAILGQAINGVAEAVSIQSRRVTDILKWIKRVTGQPQLAIKKNMIMH